MEEQEEEERPSMSWAAAVDSYLFVGKDEQSCFSKFIFWEHSLQFFTRFIDTLSIVTIDNEDKALGVLKIVSP